MPRVCLGLLILIVTAGASAAASVTYGDLASFLADTGAVGTAIPGAGGSGAVPSPQTVGPLTFSLGPGASQLFFGGNIDWTTRLAGAEIALSAMEDLDVGIASDVFAFGFEFVEVELDANLFGPFVDSTFTITLLNDGTTVESFLFSPANDVATFFGVWSSEAFDEVEIREIVGGVGNEFYGTFYTGMQPLPSPEPVGCALAALFLLARRAARQSATRPTG